MICLGIALGLVTAVACTRLLQSLVFGVSVTDWLTFATVIAIFVAAGLLACFFPARRVTVVDPMLALRDE